MDRTIDHESRGLKPGDHHYKAYVGPPEQYDFMGATQFRLLSSLGLRAHHDLLDCGCGSLRAGRLFINYLDPGKYCGIEPNTWLIEEAVNNQIGTELIRIKQPRFDHNHDFATSVFGRQFDFIIAQSIFSHTCAGLLQKALDNFKASLKPDGMIVATFVEGRRSCPGDDWVYPDCVTFRPTRIHDLAKDAGLAAVRLPWYHPRQTWYLLAHERKRLPGPWQRRKLQGIVLFEPEFSESWRLPARLLRWARYWRFRLLP